MLTGIPPPHLPLLRYDPAGAPLFRGHQQHASLLARRLPVGHVFVLCAHTGRAALAGGVCPVLPDRRPKSVLPLHAPCIQ